MKINIKKSSVYLSNNILGLTGPGWQTKGTFSMSRLEIDDRL